MTIYLRVTLLAGLLTFITVLVFSPLAAQTTDTLTGEVEPIEGIRQITVNQRNVKMLAQSGMQRVVLELNTLSLVAFQQQTRGVVDLNSRAADVHRQQIEVEQD